jgi:hypothetical protein
MAWTQTKWLQIIACPTALLSAVQIFEYAGISLTRPLVHAFIFATSTFGFFYLYCALLTALARLRFKSSVNSI